MPNPHTFGSAAQHLWFVQNPGTFYKRKHLLKKVDVENGT